MSSLKNYDAKLLQLRKMIGKTKTFKALPVNGSFQNFLVKNGYLTKVGKNYKIESSVSKLKPEDVSIAIKSYWKSRGKRAAKKSSPIKNDQHEVDNRNEIKQILEQLEITNHRLTAIESALFRIGSQI